MAINAINSAISSVAANNSAAPNGTAGKVGMKSALNAASGTIVGTGSAAKVGALSAMTTFLDPTGLTPSHTTSAPPPRGAAAAAVNPTKTDPNQAMMNAMMQKAMMDQIAKDQAKGQQATKPDGHIDTKQLDPKIIKELEKMHEGMKQYADNMKKIIQEMRKEDPDYKKYNKDLIGAMSEYANDVTKYSNPKDSDNFAPKIINGSYEKLQKQADKAIKDNPELANDPKFKQFMTEAEKANKQATLMGDIGTGNNAAVLAARNKLADESKSSLKNISTPEDNLGNEKLQSFDTAKKSLIEATENLKTDPKAKEAISGFDKAFGEYQTSFNSLDNGDKESIKEGYQKSLKPLELLSTSQDLLPQTYTGADGSVTSPEIKTQFESFNQDLYDHVSEQVGGNQSQIREYYNSMDINPPKLTEPEVTTPPPSPDSPETASLKNLSEDMFAQTDETESLTDTIKDILDDEPIDTSDIA